MHGWAEIKHVLPQPGFFSKKMVHRSHWPVFFLLISMYINSLFLLRIAHWNIYYSSSVPSPFRWLWCPGSWVTFFFLTQSCLECSRKSQRCCLFVEQYSSLKLRADFSRVVDISVVDFYFSALFVWVGESSENPEHTQFVLLCRTPPGQNQMLELAL